MRIDISANPSINQNADAILAVTAALEDLGVDVVPFQAGSVPDFHICLGGDGSVLRAVRKTFGDNAPFININTGSLGYLTCSHIFDARAALARIITGDFRIEERTTLEAAVCKKDAAESAPFHALNDIVAMRGDSGRISAMELSVNGDCVTTFLCDGIIIATPTGSTAYSLSAGGPILMPDTPAILVNIICPHTLTSRPLVLPDDSEIRVRITQSYSPVSFSCDGDVAFSLEPGDCFFVKKSPVRVRLVTLPDSGPFDKLRRKLNWCGALI